MLFTLVINYLKGPVLHVSLNVTVLKVPSNEPVDITHSVLVVPDQLVLGLFTNELPGVCEGHIGWGGPVAMIVGNNFYLAVTENTHTEFG